MVVLVVVVPNEAPSDERQVIFECGHALRVSVGDLAGGAGE